MHFWNHLPAQFVGLSPMDGVTDAAFRQMTDEIGHPAVLYTEFVPVEAIKAGAERVLQSFLFHRSKTPIIAQIYGTDLEAYRQATAVVCRLGFDGIDINMGCPAQNVHARGAGAGLIKNPAHAYEIIRCVQDATEDYVSGNDAWERVPQSVRARVLEINPDFESTEKKVIPVSVKTRIGYDLPEVETWMRTVASAYPAAVAIHGRTLKQMYRGRASWDDIRASVNVVRGMHPDIVIMGNGDINSREEAEERATYAGVDGVLIGRAAQGNPWIFQKDHVVTVEERLSAMVRHATLYTEYFPRGHFVSLRKHFAWYLSGVSNSKPLVTELQQVSSLVELQETLSRSQAALF